MRWLQKTSHLKLGQPVSLCQFGRERVMWVNVPNIDLSVFCVIQWKFMKGFLMDVFEVPPEPPQISAVSPRDAERSMLACCPSTCGEIQREKYKSPHGVPGLGEGVWSGPPRFDLECPSIASDPWGLCPMDPTPLPGHCQRSPLPGGNLASFPR